MYEGCVRTTTAAISSKGDYDAGDGNGDAAAEVRQQRQAQHFKHNNLQQQQGQHSQDTHSGTCTRTMSATASDDIRRDMQNAMQQQIADGQPLLETASGSDYVYDAAQHPQQHERGHFPDTVSHTLNQYYNRHPNHQYAMPTFSRPFAAAGTNLNGAYTSSGHSGYGMDPSNDYDYHHSAQHHPPPSSSGNAHSFHASPGTNYAAPPAYHPPMKHKNHSSKKKNSSNSTSMTALTLLSFFFFVNLLQNCIKDHMNAMNPTVMVLTVDAERNRLNKLAEINSREQSSSPASTTYSYPWSAELTPEATTVSPAAIVAASAVSLQSPHISNSNAYQPNQHVSISGEHTAYPIGNHNQLQHQQTLIKINQTYPATTFAHTQPVPYTDRFSDAKPIYPNQTSLPFPAVPDSVFNDQQEYYHANNYNQNRFQTHHSQSPYSHSQSQQQHPHQHHHQQQQAHYATSYGSGSSDHGSSPTFSHERYSSAPWSSSPLKGQSGMSTYFDAVHGYRPQRRPFHDNDDDDDDDAGHYRSGDSFYTRIN